MKFENLKPTERIFFEKYLDSLLHEERLKISHVSAGVAGNLEMADSLLNLYLNGKKTAGSSLLEDYLSAGDPLPKSGNHWIILDSHQVPRCIVRTVKVEQYRFNEIPESVAVAEGEGDFSLRYWREAHRSFFTPFLSSLKIAVLEEAQVIVEFLEVVFINDVTKPHFNEKALKFISEVAEWAQGHAKILGALLVGSYAHGKARLDSDIDIMLFVSDIGPWLQNSEEWLKLFDKVNNVRLEDWGAVKTLRAFYENGVEVEFNFTTLDWASIDPIEPNTFRVISDGAKVLYDPQGILTNLLTAVSSSKFS